MEDDAPDQPPAPAAGVTALAAAVAGAPTGPGIYVFLGADGELLYVGKAANLRRRLRDHAGAGRGGGVARRRYARVREVRWEETPDEEVALMRESGLIVALRPSLNRTLASEGRWAYLVARGLDGADRRARFELTARPGAGGRVYGCFPHLGPGLASPTGIACSDGYTALLRLLWAADPAAAGRPMPQRIGGTTPPAAFETRVGPAWHRPLHACLSGRTPRVIAALAQAAADHVQDYQRPGLTRDVAGAEAFFAHGPQALRRLRLRHGRPGRCRRQPSRGC